jgi:hypothetical protein
MHARLKISRNDPCPCGRGLKYKKCCEGEVPWEELISQPPSVQIKYLSARGKNMVFLNKVASLLHLDKPAPALSWGDVKKAITPQATRAIYESVAEIWPDGSDLKRVLESEKGTFSGLYVGTYTPEKVLRGVARHCLYSERMLLVDPFMHPVGISEAYNPLLHPDQYQTVAISNLRLWWSLAPWIDAGLVSIVRTPGDFDPWLNWECMKLEEQRLQQHPELESLLSKGADLLGSELRALKEYHFLGHSDTRVAEIAREAIPGISAEEISGLLDYVRRRRTEHPFLPETPGSSQLLIFSTGANYELARRTALLSGSHLITDLPYRWKEIELDRQEARVDDRPWAPFAKALQNANLKHLENVDLSAALHLRKQDRLESMRNFLRRVWRACSGAEPFAEENAVNLASELDGHIREAEHEWREIDRELLKWAASGGAAGLAAAGPSIAVGGAAWVAASVAAVGAASIVNAEFKRAGFEKRFPAGFFLRPHS